MIGPLDPQPSQAAFEHVLSGVRAIGYQPMSADPPNGLIVVPAGTRSRAGVYTFRLQCFAGGYLQIVPAGPRVHGTGDRYSVPWPVQNEIGAFAERLDRQLRGLGR